MATDSPRSRYDTRRGRLQSLLRSLGVLFVIGLATPIAAGAYWVTGAGPFLYLTGGLVVLTAVVFLWVFYTASESQLKRLFEAL